MRGLSAVPDLPRWLGLAGLLPQVGLVVALYAGPPEWYEAAALLAYLYAGLVFAFLGGTWWGIAACAPAAQRRRTHGWVWIAGVLPSLIVFAGLVPPLLGTYPMEPSLVALGGALLISPAVDARLGALAPRWWTGLRLPLSLGLGALTIGAALA